MALEGSLKDIDITDLVQVYSNKGRTCRLTTRYGSLEGMIFFHEGNIIHASVGPLIGENAFTQLLKWKDGSFKIETDIEGDVEMPKVTIVKDTRKLINESLKKIEEGEEDEMLLTLKERINEIPDVEAVATLSPSDLWVGKQIGKENLLATVCTRAEMVSKEMGMGEFRCIEMQGDRKHGIVYKLGSGYLVAWIKPTAEVDNVRVKIEKEIT